MTQASLDFFLESLDIDRLKVCLASNFKEVPRQDQEKTFELPRPRCFSDAEFAPLSFTSSEKDTIKGLIQK